MYRESLLRTKKTLVKKERDILARLARSGEKKNKCENMVSDCEKPLTVKGTCAGKFRRKKPLQEAFKQPAL